MRRSTLAEQRKEKIEAVKSSKKTALKKANEGNFKTVISTGSTLLDLAISGKRVRGGGCPGGIVVEAFGPSQSGKTALLSEMAGELIRKGGDSQFHDPEARLDAEFAAIFGMTIDPEKYYQPDTVTQVFQKVNVWEAEPTIPNAVNGIFADSLAALSTDLEMEKAEGDKMGTRRAKEFSEQLRKNCRIIKQKNYLMVCSNQIRMNIDAGPYAAKFSTPGGKAFEFYASVRLKFGAPTKIYKTVKIAGKEQKKVIGVETEIEVIKTVDEPYRKCSIVIKYGYGIDDIMANLQYIKTNTTNTTYCVGDQKLSTSLEEAIQKVEELDLVTELKNEVIDLWEEIQEKFTMKRKSKQR